jgi:acyl-coenzyme A thioesterase PaaI-like protein
LTRFERLKATVALRLWSLAKIRLIAWVRPRVVELTPDRCEIVVPLNWRTRNHLRSMYFGALCTGADAAGALIALEATRRAGGSIAVVFKDVHAEFVKRAESDVHFACEQGREILALMEKAAATGERENLPLYVTATVPKLLGPEPVARFTLTLSVRKRAAG